PAFVKPLTEATAVFFSNGHSDRIFNAYRGTLFEKELKKVLARGGLVGGTGTGAAVLGELLADRSELGHTEPGLGLLPGFLTDDRTDRPKGFPEAVDASPGKIGLLFPPDTALVIRGNEMRVLGTGTVTIRIPSANGKESKVQTVKPGAKLDII